MKLHFTRAGLFLVLIITAVPLQALEEQWKNSYKFEAAGKYIEAIAAIDQISVNSPEAELKTLRRGWLFYLHGSFNESIREYRFAIDRNKKSVDARLGLILPFLAQKRWRDAEISARAALELAPENYLALLRLAIAQEGQHDWSGMEMTSNELITSYPSDVIGYVYLARSQASLNKKNEAVAAYTAVLSRYPGYLEANNYIGKK